MPRFRALPLFRSNKSRLWDTGCRIMGTDESESAERSILMYEFRNVRGHVEVYDLYGRFLFSADTEREAREELEAA